MATEAGLGSVGSAVPGVPERRDSVTADDDASLWPAELLPIRGRVFTSVEELDTALEELGIPDARVELDSDGRVVVKMPGEEHNAATGYIDSKLNDFRKDLAGRLWGFVNSTVAVRVVGSPNVSARREPDNAFWAYPRCDVNPRNKNLTVKQHPTQVGYRIDPDVIIQFSWKNPELYEQQALDDLMNRAGTTPDTRVRVGWLIKARFRYDRVTRTSVPERFDIYKVFPGDNITDVMDINQAQFAAQRHSYTPGGADFELCISAAELGFEPPATWYQKIDPRYWPRYSTFKLSMLDLWEALPI